MDLRNKLFLLVLFVFAFLKLQGQNHRLDSLRNELSNSKHDTLNCDILLEMGKIYEMISPDSSIVYYNNCLDIAIKHNHKNLEATAKRYIGNWYIDQRDYETAMEYFMDGLRIAEENNNKIEIGRINNSIGLVYNSVNNFEKALEFSNIAIKIAEEIDDKITLSYSYNNIGLAYYNQSIYDEALKYFLISAKIDEDNGDIKGLSQGYLNIGLIHYSMGNYEQTIFYYKKAIKISEELGEIIDMSIGYNNIAIIYKEIKEYSLALEFLFKALAIDKDLGDEGGMAICYINIGDVYSNTGNPNLARKYFMESLRIWDKLNDKSGVATVFIYLADLNIKLAILENENVDFRDSLLLAAAEYGEKSLNIANETNQLPLKNSAALSLKDAYSNLGNFEKAFEYLEIYVTTKEQLINEEKIRSIADAEMQWDTERKQLQIEQLQKEGEISKLELTRQMEETEQQRAIILLISAGLIIISVLVFFLSNRLRLTKKQNQIIEAQKQIVEENLVRLNEKNEEIRAQNEEIEAQNHEIQSQRDLAITQKEFIERQNLAMTDSINYAKRIQQALLPDLEMFEVNNNGFHEISDSFVLFKPKEIVSGDFYWANRIDNHLIIALADCTGHGVPGGFMSMLGISFLNEIVNKQENYVANEILNELRDNVSSTLSQAGKKDEYDTPILDGINIVIAVIDLESFEMQYSGSYNPLYMIRNNQLNILKTDKTTIGVFVKNRDSFTNYHLKLQKNDTFYMFSDGYIDQFDEAGNQRYKYSRFKNLLLSIHDKQMDEQKEILETTLEKWKGNNDQIDDITILGFKV